MGKALIIKGADFHVNALENGEPRQLTVALDTSGACLSEYRNDVSEIAILQAQAVANYKLYKIDPKPFLAIEVTTTSQKSASAGASVACVAIFNEQDVCIGALPMRQSYGSEQTFNFNLENYPGADYILVDAGPNKPTPTATGSF